MQSIANQSVLAEYMLVQLLIHVTAMGPRIIELLDQLSYSGTGRGG